MGKRGRVRALAVAAGALAALALPAAAPAAPDLSAPAPAAPAPAAPDLSATAQAATAQAAEEEAAVRELGLTVTAGYGGQLPSQEWVPVEVSVQPTRLVAGRLTVLVRPASGTVAESRDIEVAAGSRKVYRFLVPFGPLRVRVDEAGRDRPAEATLRMQWRSSPWVAGHLGPLPDQLPPLQHEPTGTSGTWAEVDPAWVELAPQALDGLGALVAPAARLDELSDAGARNLAAAVVRGVDLVVVPDRAGGQAAGTGLGRLGLPDPSAGVAAGPSVVPAAGAATLMGDDGTVVAVALPAGRGRVAVVAGGPAERRPGLSGGRVWSELVGPNPYTIMPTSETVERNPWLANRLVRPGSTEPPRVPWLGAFLVAYVLVVGPVNGLVLARLGRRELAWVTVPLVSAVFTAGAFAGAVGERPPVGMAGGVGVWVDGVGTEIVAAAVRSPTPGTHRFTLPDQGWTVRPVVELVEPASVSRGSGVTVDLPLEALQVGTVIASRPTHAAAPLHVQAAATGDGLDVTVTNASTTSVGHVRIRAGTAVRRLGTLAPGESRTVSVGRDRLAPVDPYQSPVHEVLFDEGGAPRTLEALVGPDLVDGNPGLVWAVGEVAQAGRLPGGSGSGGSGSGGSRSGGASPLGLVDGSPPVDLGGLVVVGARLEPARRHPSPYAAQRVLFTTDWDGYRPSPLAVEGPGTAFLRFRLADPGRVTALRSDLRADARLGHMGRPQVDLAVWSPAERTWVALDEAFPRDDETVEPGRVLSPLGDVYVRASGDLFPFDASARTISGVYGEARS